MLSYGQLYFTLIDTELTLANGLKRARENKLKIKYRLIISVVIEGNDDENHVNELSEVLCQPLVMKPEELIEEQVQYERKNSNRCSIIREFNDGVYGASDEWLKQYILCSTNMIIERFEQNGQ